MSSSGAALPAAHPVEVTGRTGAPDAADLEAFHARHPASASDRRRTWRLVIVLEVVAILAVWELAVSGLGLVRPTFMPPPSAIAGAFVELVARPTFLDHLWFSLVNLVVGVTLAAVVGVTVGLAVGWSRLLDVTVSPFLWALYSIPKVAFAPLIILALGLGAPSKVFLVFLLGVFPIALNTIEGVRTIEPSLVQAARVFGTNGIALSRKVILPAVLPYVLIGLRRAVALGFIGAMLGEFLGGSKGIGHLLNRAAREFHMDQALALVVVMIAVANIGLVVTGIAQRRFAPWSR